ncbi:MAG: diguanylate cyclase [Pyrinomonadaceae bacterium]
MRILIAEDNPVARRVLKATLTQWGHEVVSTVDGQAALDVLAATDPPLLAILDWELPKLDGTDICRKVRELGSSTPPYLILLTARNSREALVEGLAAGADDFLTKPFDQSELQVRLQAASRIVDLQQSLATRVRDLEQAIVERQRAEEALRLLSLTDDLTGLLNRRGFFNLAEHQLKMARRQDYGSMLVYGDLDGLKAINDSLGHSVGSDAISAMAEVLRLNFRDSDLLARMGGDEFVVLVANVQCTDGPAVLNRLQRSVESYVREVAPPFRLAISTGATYVEPDTTLSLDELIVIADQAMYECKRQRRTSAELGEKLPNYVLHSAELRTPEQPHEIIAGR